MFWSPRSRRATAPRQRGQPVPALSAMAVALPAGARGRPLRRRLGRLGRRTRLATSSGRRARLPRHADGAPADARRGARPRRRPVDQGRDGERLRIAQGAPLDGRDALPLRPRGVRPRPRQGLARAPAGDRLLRQRRARRGGDRPRRRLAARRLHSRRRRASVVRRLGELGATVVVCERRRARPATPACAPRAPRSPPARSRSACRDPTTASPWKARARSPSRWPRRSPPRAPKSTLCSSRSAAAPSLARWRKDLPWPSPLGARRAPR